MKMLLSFLFLVIVTGTLAQEPDSSSALFKMREAEYSFAKSSVMNGRKAAFAEFLAEKAVIFTDKWITSGKQFWQIRPPAPVILKWEPEYMDISAGRNFGISTGPWEAQEFRPNTPPLSRGYFLSVWEVQSDGSWKVILDFGINCPEPAGSLHKFNFPDGDDKDAAGRTTDASFSGLTQLEEKMLISWKNNPSPENYRSFFCRDVRIMRNGHLPSNDPDTLKALTMDLGKNFEWKQEGSGLSSSGDLGFTYGNAIFEGKLKGFYVRIWERDRENEMKIKIDLISID